MDSVSQFVLGASVSVAVMGRRLPICEWARAIAIPSPLVWIRLSSPMRGRSAYRMNVPLCPPFSLHWVSGCK